MRINEHQREALKSYLRQAKGGRVHPMHRIMFIMEFGFDPGCGDPSCEGCGDSVSRLLGGQDVANRATDQLIEAIKDSVRKGGDGQVHESKKPEPPKEPSREQESKRRQESSSFEDLMRDTLTKMFKEKFGDKANVVVREVKPEELRDFVTRKTSASSKPNNPQQGETNVDGSNKSNAKNGKTLGDEPNEYSAADVVHQGEKVILPESMSIDQGIELLKRRRDYLGQEVSVFQDYDAFPYDGAAALDRVLAARYGWAPAVRGAWGSPPAVVTIPSGLGQTMQVPWGRFSLPNVSGFVETAVTKATSGRVTFRLAARCLRGDEAEVRRLFALVGDEVRDNSIYRGKAVSIRFVDDAGKRIEMPEITFIDTAVDEALLIFSRTLQDSIETNLFTPIDRLTDCEANGIQFKRGVLLGGTYGTGKTLAARVAAKKSVAAGLTYLYIKHASELALAAEFARLYQSPGAVIFVEDIDRAMSGDRSDEMDQILNTIDGIDGKRHRIMVVTTTNDLASINPAMLRPGRLDAVINVTPPDADAVQRLLRSYGGASIPRDEDLSEAGRILSGQVPAVIAEVVKRAKLAQLKRLPVGSQVALLTGAALAEAANTMASQVKLLNPPPKVEQPTLDSVMRDVVRQVMDETDLDAVPQLADETLDVAKAIARTVDAN